MRWLLALVVLARLPLAAGSAADLARTIRENSFDRDECYRVRDLTLVKEDIHVYLTDDISSSASRWRAARSPRSSWRIPAAVTAK